MDTAHGATTDKEIQDEIRENFRADCISCKRDQRKHEKNRPADKGEGAKQDAAVYTLIYLYFIQ